MGRPSVAVLSPWALESATSRENGVRSRDLLRVVNEQIIANGLIETVLAV